MWTNQKKWSEMLNDAIHYSKVNSTWIKPVLKKSGRKCLYTHMMIYYEPSPRYIHIWFIMNFHQDIYTYDLLWTFTKIYTHMIYYELSPRYIHIWFIMNFHQDIYTYDLLWTFTKIYTHMIYYELSPRYIHNMQYVPYLDEYMFFNVLLIIFA